MIDALYTAYNWALLPVMLMALVHGVMTDREPLIRAVWTILLGQGIIELYGLSVDYSHQPWLVYALINGISCRILTIKPTGPMLNVLSGVFFGAFLLSIMTGLISIISPSGVYVIADVMFWKSQLVTGWLCILVVLGGQAGDTGKRVLSAFWRRMFGLSEHSRHPGF
jgi:hypothetical protein